jgi:uncharacterized protein (TIGR02302 family)
LAADEWTARPDGERARRARRYIAFSRLILWWERIWPALWPALGFIGAYAILALFGVLAALPASLHVLIVLGLCGVAVYFLWRRLARIDPPVWEEAARRLERDSRLEHRPITEGADTIAAGKGDALSEGLWRAHMMRLFARAKHLRLKPPSPKLGREDKYFLRFVVLAGVLAGIAFAGGEWWNRIVGGFAPVVGARTQAVVTAWVSPPAYTGRAPLSLSRARPDGPLAVPQKSILVIRLSGTEAKPSLNIRPTPAGVQPRFKRIASGYEVRIALESDAEIEVKLGSHTLGAWNFAVQRDRIPAIAFSEPPQSSTHQALRLAYRAVDDYGVVRTEAHIVPVDKLAQGATNAGALIVPLSTPGASKDVQETVYRDLTSHAYAGLKVAITLVAIDAAGQKGLSRPAIVVLPQRIFTHPLAKALIEQRTALALGLPNALTRATTVVDALTIAPERFYKDDFSLYLAMRALFYELKGVKTGDDTKKAMALMWDIAVAVEEGDLANAAEDLRRAREQLMSALERGASEAELEALMERFRQAMQRYLQALAQNAPQNNQQPQQNAMNLSPQDLAALLKALEDLTRTGAHDQARQLLAALAQLLENLQMSQGPSETEQAMGEALKGLSDLLGDQRQLLDKTFRAQRGQGTGQGLAPEQGGLRDKLGKIIEGLQQKGVQPPQGLGRAGEAMQESQRNLQGGQLGSAEQAEQNAIEQLRQGAQALAKQMMPDGPGQGQAAAQGAVDPLGRQSGRGQNFGGSVRVPNQSDLQRAREILEELRRRAGDNARTREELDYIERLLKQF